MSKSLLRLSKDRLSLMSLTYESSSEICGKEAIIHMRGERGREREHKKRESQPFRKPYSK